MPRPRGVEALLLGVLVFSCSLDEFGDGPALVPGDASTGGVFTGGASGFGGFPDASLGGVGGGIGGAPSGGGTGGADAGFGGGGIDGGAGTDSGSGGTDAGTGGAPTWKPSDIPNCQVWLDAEDVSTMTLSGQDVTAWSSKCGSTSVTAAAPSAPGTLLVGTHRVVRCDGVNDELTFTGSPVQAPAYSLFFVISKNFAGVQKAIWSNRSVPVVTGVTKTFVGHYSQLMFMFQDSATPKVTPSAKTAVLTAPILYEVVVSPGKRELVLDGTVEAADSASGTATLLAAGALCADNGTNFAAYDVREVVAYDRELSALERQKVRSELQAKWGL